MRERLVDKNKYFFNEKSQGVHSYNACVCDYFYIIMTGVIRLPVGAVPLFMSAALLLLFLNSAPVAWSGFFAAVAPITVVSFSLFSFASSVLMASFGIPISSPNSPSPNRTNEQKPSLLDNTRVLPSALQVAQVTAA